MDRLLAGRRILVVEDEMMVLMMIEDMLADLGCEAVTVAATVDAAVTLSEEQVFHAAMVDLNLNGEDSYVVADALIARGVPFVFSTGSSALRDSYRDHPVLKKPYSDERLAEALRGLLSR